MTDVVVERVEGQVVEVRGDRRGDGNGRETGGGGEG